MCEYCLETNMEDQLRGSDGVVYDTENQEYNLYVEHFRNERHWIPVNFCPQCGKKLTKER
ncbi:hypothetical protein P4571_08135 [Niallia alba]|uniref:hypothetical protein n=1 Tax=Niallia alba TaxID=2729105 RepID=UPI002E1E877C|nr:hypothetical protein [Niallia alba]